MALQALERLRSDEGRIPQPEPALRSPTRESRAPASDRPRHGEHLFARDVHVVGFAPMLLDQGNELILVAPGLEAAVTTNHELGLGLMLGCRNSASSSTSGSESPGYHHLFQAQVVEAPALGGRKEASATCVPHRYSGSVT